MSDPTVSPPIGSFTSMDNVKEYFLKEPFVVSQDPLYDYVQTNSGVFPKNNFGGGSYDPDVQKLKDDVAEIQNTLSGMQETIGTIQTAARDASIDLSPVEGVLSNYEEVNDIISSVISVRNTLSGYFEEIS